LDDDDDFGETAARYPFRADTRNEVNVGLIKSVYSKLPVLEISHIYTGENNAGKLAMERERETEIE
jgi:hypothetical protein